MLRLFGLLALTALLSACGGGGGDAGRNRQAPLVEVARVGAVEFTDRIDAVGTARANEQVTLAAPVTERIEKLFFNDGQYIEKGRVVAVLARGQESAQLAQADAGAAEAAKQLARLKALRAQGFATQSALDAQLALEQQARAQAAEARASIGDRVIRAPFGGFVSLRNISAGAVVTAGTEIATISDIDPIKLDFPVPETLLGQVKPGQPIDVRAAAFADQPFHGRIETIDPVLDPQTRAATVRAILPNPGNQLKPGMLLSVSIAAKSRRALAVPELAVVGDGDQSFVFVVENGKARRVAVKTGLRQNGLVEITDGLRAGQSVVTEGVVKITDGAAVRLDDGKDGGKDGGDGAAAKKGG